MLRTVLKHEEEPQSEGLLRGPVHQPICYLFQGILLYAFNQVFFTFTAGYNDRINFSMHPFSGGAGQLRYDLYPALSATFMTLHKYGPFLLATIFLFEFTRPESMAQARAHGLPSGSALLENHSGFSENLHPLVNDHEWVSGDGNLLPWQDDEAHKGHKLNWLYSSPRPEARAWQWVGVGVRFR